MVRTQLDWDRPGKQQGFLQVPYSHNLGGWANVMVPATVVSRGAGPTVLILGGNHGDEYQGQIAGMKLASSLQPDQVQGRIIIVPSLNLPAARAATRLSPLDGMNLNRAFPGTSDGAVTGQIAHYLTHTLFPMSDVVIDMHSGGRSMEFVPCSHMHLVPDREQRRQMLDAMLAWNTDFSFLYTDIAGSGLLPVEAENQGKVVVTTEMGGSERIPASVHRLVYRGLLNVLRHVGVLEGAVETRQSLGLPPAILVQALEAENYLLAPESGIFEVGADLGQYVEAGETVGWIHHLERPDRAPEVLVAPKSGYVITVRAPCLTQQGDCVVVIAQPIELQRVLG